MRTHQIVFEAPRQLRLAVRDMPDAPPPHAARLRTRVSFISAGTELAIYAGTDPRLNQPGSGFAYPHEPGYANVAEVIAQGTGMHEHGGLRPGQRIFTLHPHKSVYDFTVGDWDMAEPVPDSLSDDEAAAARMALVAITALQVADLAAGDTAAVFGLGAVGNLAAQLLQVAAVRVVGIDPVASRCQLARDCGIEQVVHATAETAGAQVRALLGGGPTISIDAVGHGAIIEQAIELAPRHGQVVVLGSPRAAHTADLSAVMQKVFKKLLTIRGALEWRLPRRANLDPHARHTTEGNLRYIFDLMVRGRLRVAPLVSHRIPAAQATKAYEGLLEHKDRFIGVVLDWSGLESDEPVGA